MTSSNDYINESVFNTNLKYVRLQNKTKELFFKCLDEGRDLDYFKEELEKIWGNVDHKFFKAQLEEYENIVHRENLNSLDIKEDIPKVINTFIGLVALGIILKQEKKFITLKEREYKLSLKSNAYKVAKDEYLKNKVQKYTNQIVPYFSKTTGKKIRDVQLSTYTAMIHNTNLTRAGWNTTISDAENLGYREFYIPPHSFSCPYCAYYQGRPLSVDEVTSYLGLEAEEQEGDILHPNCKCVLAIYSWGMNIRKQKYTPMELQQQYDIRQKTNSLTLKKEQLLSDIKIQKSLGNYDEVDKLNSQRNKINSQIRELKEQLPTKELQKQVTAINR